MAEIVTLSKESKLFSRFHALRYDSLHEASSHGDHRANDGGIVALGSDSLHEQPVHLQDVDRKLTQLSKLSIIARFRSTSLL
jgi:hypothetical protein